MCPVVLLAMLFSFIMLLLELTAAVNVTFFPGSLKNITEGEIGRVNFSAVSTSILPNEALYKVISDDPGIAEVTDVSFASDDHFLNGSFVVNARFLGRTSIRVKKTNDTENRGSQKLDVSVVRRERAISKAFTVSVIILVSLNQINMGCAMDLSVVKNVLKKPIAPVIGFISQYVVMPSVAYGLGLLLFNDAILQLGLFTFGCSPGGGASNMWTVLLKGNLNLSLTMTFISNLAALGMMPLWLFTLGRKFFSNTDSRFPYEKILTTPSIMLVTLGVGLILQRRLPKVAAFCRRILAPVSVAMIIFIIIFGTYANLYMFRLFTFHILVGAAALVWLGFLFGAILSRLAGLHLEDIIAIAIETGIQNTGVTIMMLGIALEQPDSDLAAVVPVAASIATPFPLLCGCLYLWVRRRYFTKVVATQLYIVDDVDEKKALPANGTSDSGVYTYTQMMH